MFVDKKALKIVSEYNRNLPPRKYKEKYFNSIFYPQSSISLRIFTAMLFNMEGDRKKFNADISFDFNLNYSFGREYIRNSVFVDGVEFFNQHKLSKEYLLNGDIFFLVNFYLKITNTEDYDLEDKFKKTHKELMEIYFPPIEPEKIYIYPKETETQQKQKEWRNSFCYLMVDDATGYVKIGRSVNPKARERTLQSEKPTIRMLHYFEKNHERELHELYREKRIRGEWFDLKENEITKIINQYK